MRKYQDFLLNLHKIDFAHQFEKKTSKFCAIFTQNVSKSLGNFCMIFVQKISTENPSQNLRKVEPLSQYLNFPSTFHMAFNLPPSTHEI